MVAIIWAYGSRRIDQPLSDWCKFVTSPKMAENGWTIPNEFNEQRLEFLSYFYKIIFNLIK